MGQGEREGEKGKQKKLKAFRAFVQDGGTVKHWNTPDELGGKVATTLAPLLKKSDRPGWMRGMNREDKEKIASLEKDNAQLRQQADAAESKWQELIGEKFADGHKLISIQYHCEGPAVVMGMRGGNPFNSVRHRGQIQLTYNEIVRALVRAVDCLCPEYFFAEQLACVVREREMPRWERNLRLLPQDPISFEVARDSVADVLVRLEQLEILQRTTYKSGESFWRLTSRGKSICTRLRFG